MSIKEMFKPNKINLILTLLLFVILSSFLPIIPVSFSRPTSLPFFPSILPTTSLGGYSTLFNVVKNYKDVKSVNLLFLFLEFIFIFGLTCVLAYFMKSLKVSFRTKNTNPI